MIINLGVYNMLNRSSQYYQYSLLSSNWKCEGSDSCYAAILTSDANKVSIECSAENTTIDCSYFSACETISIYSIFGSKALQQIIYIVVKHLLNHVFYKMME